MRLDPSLGLVASMFSLGPIACGGEPRDARDESGRESTGAEEGDAEGGASTSTSTSTSAGTGSASGSDGGTSSSSGSEASSEASSSEGGVRLDVGSGSTSSGEGGGVGCQKVDFLFAVDNSGSMEAQQATLAAAFPGFIAAIRDKVAGHRYNVMVIDSDAAGTWCCEPDARVGMPAQGDCGDTCAETSTHDYCQGYTCGEYAMLDAADNTLGCGVVRPYGGLASNRDCGIDGDRRYMTETQPDLEGAFACLTKVGISGHWWERPVTATVAALSPELTGTGGCNQGFLRPDAILVLTIISDDPPMTGDLDDAMGSNGTAQQWFDAIVAAKGGDVSSIVMMGAFRGSNGLPIGPPQVFYDLVALFGDQGRLAHVENVGTDLTRFFVDTVDLIDLTCDEFIPPG